MNKSIVCPNTSNRTEYMSAYMKAYRNNKKELGLCLDCMEPAVTKNYCKRHQDYREAYGKAYREEVRIHKVY
jgi:hypothetical protein